MFSYQTKPQFWCILPFHAKYHLDWLILSPLEAKKTNITIVSTSAYCGGVIYRQKDKVEYGCATTNFPMASKSFQSSNGLIAISHSQTVPFKSTTNKNTQKT